VLCVNDQPLVVCRDTDLFRPELTYVKTETKHFPAASAISRTVIEHVAEIHLFQQVLAATAATAAAVSVVCRLQPEEVVAQARHLCSNFQS